MMDILKKINNKKIIFGICSFFIFCIFADYNIQKKDFEIRYKRMEENYKKISEYEYSGIRYKTKYLIIYKKRITKKYKLFRMISLPIEIETFKPMVRTISTIETEEGDKITCIKFASDKNFVVSKQDEENKLKNELIGDDVDRDYNNAFKIAVQKYPLDYAEIENADSVRIEKSGHDWLKNSNQEHYVNVNGIWKVDYIDITNNEFKYRRRGSKAITEFLDKKEEIKTVYFDDETYEVKERYFYENGKIIEGYRYNVFGDVIEIYNIK